MDRNGTTLVHAQTTSVHFIRPVADPGGAVRATVGPFRAFAWWSTPTGSLPGHFSHQNPFSGPSPDWALPTSQPLRGRLRESAKMESPGRVPHCSMCCDKKFSTTNVNVLLHGCADAQLAQDTFCEIPKQSITHRPRWSTHRPISDGRDAGNVHSIRSSDSGIRSRTSSGLREVSLITHHFNRMVCYNRTNRHSVRKHQLSTHAPGLHNRRALLPLASLLRLRYEHASVSTRTLPLHARERTCPSPGFALPFLGVGISHG